MRLSLISLLIACLARLTSGQSSDFCTTASATSFPRTPGEVKAVTFGLASYNTHDRPGVAAKSAARGVTAPAEKIYVAMNVLSLIEVNTKSQTFTVDVVLRLIWQDDRMIFNATCFQPDLCVQVCGRCRCIMHVS